MQLENEARAKMGDNDVGGGGDDGDRSRASVEGVGGQEPENDVRSSNGSGGYRYAAIEQAMDASASGKRHSISQ